MNCDENQDVPGSQRILAIPTVVFFKDGREVDRLVGVNVENKFVQSLREKCGVA
jgi:thioredoxin-like negative regulator of GroEL